MREFQTPKSNGRLPVEKILMRDFGPFDRIIGGILVAIVIGLLYWMANTNQQNTIKITELSGKLDTYNMKLEAIKSDRDLSLVYIERRLDRLETVLNDDFGNKKGKIQ